MAQMCLPETSIRVVARNKGARWACRFVELDGAGRMVVGLKGPGGYICLTVRLSDNDLKCARIHSPGNKGGMIDYPTFCRQMNIHCSLSALAMSFTIDTQWQYSTHHEEHGPDSHR